MAGVVLDRLSEATEQQVQEAVEQYREVLDMSELLATGLDLVSALAQWLHDRQGQANLRTIALDPQKPRCAVTVTTRWFVYTVTADDMPTAVRGATETIDQRLREQFGKTQPGTSAAPLVEEGEAEPVQQLDPEQPNEGGMLVEG